MSDLNLLLCCPHCGGKNGYQYTRLELVTVNAVWGGEEEGQCEGVERETKPRCSDCNKIIKAT